MKRAQAIAASSVLAACSALGLDDVAALPCDRSALDPTEAGHLCAALNRARDRGRDCELYQCSRDGTGCVLAPQDLDGDGFFAATGPCAGRGNDCDDGDPDVHPEADERCDGRDDDCDGEFDEDTSWRVTREQPLALGTDARGSLVPGPSGTELVVTSRLRTAMQFLVLRPEGATSLMLSDGTHCGPGKKCSFDELALCGADGQVGYVGRGQLGDAVGRLVMGELSTPLGEGLSLSAAEALGDAPADSLYSVASVGTELHVAVREGTQLRVYRRVLGSGRALIADGFGADGVTGQPWLATHADAALLAYLRGDTLELACADARAGDSTRYEACGTVAGLSPTAVVVAYAAMGEAPPSRSAPPALVVARTGSGLVAMSYAPAAGSTPPVELTRAVQTSDPVLVALPDGEVPRWLVLYDEPELGGVVQELRSSEDGALEAPRAPGELGIAEAITAESRWLAATADTRDSVRAVRGETQWTLRCGSASRP